MRRERVEPVKLPYSVTALHRKQQALLSDPLITAHFGKRLDDVRIRDLARHIHENFGYATIPRSFFELSLDTFLGRVVHAEEWSRRLRRIAAYMAMKSEFLPSGYFPPAVDWEHQPKDEMIPVLVRDIEAQDTKKTIWSLDCLAIGGTPAETRFTYRVSLKMGYRIASMAGFSRKPMYAYFGSPRQFVGLILVMQIASGSELSRVKINDVFPHNPTVQINKDLIRQRNPDLDRDCPYSIKTWCHMCVIGREACPLATRKTTLQDPHLAAQPEPKQRKK